MAKRSLHDNETALWRMVMRDVAPLRSSKRCLPSPEPIKADKILEKHKKKAVRSDALRAFQRTRSEERKTPKKMHDLAVGVRSPGLDNTQWRRLSRGKMPVDARLDLHGYLVQEAFELLLNFMHRARSMRWRCVEIVTGLGSGSRGGTIRREVPMWLQRSDVRPMILAVVYSHHGNQGAVRVLIKRPKS